MNSSQQMEDHDMMTEELANKRFDFYQRVRYDEGKIDVYFDVEVDADERGMTLWTSDKSQAYYNGTNITKLVNWEKVDEAIDWKAVKDEQKERDEQ